jgi:transcriptional regulator NrdR family protein
VYEVGKKDYGVIAQEVEEVLPELVTTRENGYKAVRYEKIVSLLIEAIKEQQIQIDELKNMVIHLTEKINNL